MILRNLYQKAIETGMANDPRGRDAVLQELQRLAKEHEELKQDEKDLFDLDSLTNPYSDSRILHGSGDEEIGQVLVGVDIEVGEILLTDTLRNRGEKIDLVLAHHPEGRAFANLSAVMHMQSDILNLFGVPINIAEDLMEGRAKEIERRLMPVNHTRAVDAARLLNIPFLCLHTPAYNMVVTFLQRLFDEKKPHNLGDLFDLLKAIPEYTDAMKLGAGPKILLGSKKRRAGKVFVDMTGGTEGAKDIFQSLANAGVNTIVGMHMSEEHRKEAEKNHLNVVIAGHISSDNLGLNLLLDETLQGSEVRVLECSGYKRVDRRS
ncbi:MAG: NGG1p interacting factor NIF3 [Nitrospirae bacterium]|nr:NGG1p interacting factor NIF3 [Nitrospirota bacterium]